jgi:hypothetical protein
MKPKNLLTQNSKIKKMSGPRTFNFGIPAYRSSSGFNTCPKAGACAVGCYATMGAYRFSNVARAFEERLTATLAPEFSARMVAEIKARRVERLRIHDSGDFYSAEYVAKWFDVMRACPDVAFYAYTKQVVLFKALTTQNAVPPNFTLIYSFGGTEDKKIDVKTDRHSWVFSSVEELEAAGYAAAYEDDAGALGPNPKIGLVYHGNKNIENTAWGRVKKAG